MSTSLPFGPPIFSQIDNDADMAELIVMFVEEMPARAALIEQSFSGKEWKNLANEAHKLRGSAGGHGFSKLGKIAGALEDVVRDAAGLEEARVQEIRSQVEQLTSYCRRVAVRK